MEFDITGISLRRGSFQSIRALLAHLQYASRSEVRHGTSIMMDQQGTEYVWLLSDHLRQLQKTLQYTLSNIYLSNISAVKLG